MTNFQMGVLVGALIVDVIYFLLCGEKIKFRILTLSALIAASIWLVLIIMGR